MIVHFYKNIDDTNLVNVVHVTFKKDPIIGEYYELIDIENKKFIAESIDADILYGDPVILAKAKRRNI